MRRAPEATALTRADIEALQETVRRRVLRWFRRQGLPEEHTVRGMLGWDHGAPRGAWSGFSLDASVRIAAHDRAGLEQLLRYCTRLPFALNRIEWQDSGGSDGEGVVLYRLPRPTPDGRTLIRLSPLEFLDRLAALVPPPRVHRHRYHGVLAPNSPLRPAAVASAGEAATLPFPQTTPPRPVSTLSRRTARSNSRRISSRWAALLARILIGQWVDHYNHNRLHAALQYLPPAEYYEAGGNPEARIAERKEKLERARKRRERINRERLQAAA